MIKIRFVKIIRRPFTFKCSGMRIVLLSALPILVEMTENLSEKKSQRLFLKLLQGIWLHTFSCLQLELLCSHESLFFNNGNCCNYNHFRIVLLLLIRPNCMVQADTGSKNCSKVLQFERTHIMGSATNLAVIAMPTWPILPAPGPCLEALTRASWHMPVTPHRVTG